MKFGTENDYDTFIKWVKSNPDKAHSILALRSALRVFRISNNVLGSHERLNTGQFASNYLLPLLRKLSLIWPSRVERQGSLEPYTHEAFEFAKRVKALCEYHDFDWQFLTLHCSSSARHAVYAHTKEGCLDSIIHSIPHPDYSWPSPYLKAILKDIEFLESNPKIPFQDRVESLSREPLWHYSMHDEAVRNESSINKVFERLKPLHQDWDIWHRWCLTRLNGEPTIKDASPEIVKKLDISIAMIPNEDWEKGAAHINAKIKGFYEQAEKEATKRGFRGLCRKLGETLNKIWKVLLIFLVIVPGLYGFLSAFLRNKEWLLENTAWNPSLSSFTQKFIDILAVLPLL